MTTWQAIVGNTTYELSDRNPFDVVSVMGVGIAPTRRLSQRGPLQHGETDIGYRLDPRMVTLVLVSSGESLAAADTHRDTLARIFAPRLTTPVKLRYTRDDAAVRELACRVSGIVDMPIGEFDRIGVMQRVGVQLVAADPNWYDPDPQQMSMALASISSGLAVPVEVPLLVESGSGGDGRIQIEYTGTFDEFPIITLVGPIEDALIVNETTGDELFFDGYTITAGTSVTIDLRYGYKTVTKNDGTNLIDKLTSGSDLATWRLASILETGDGVNVIRLSGASLTDASQVSMIYHTRYISL